MTEAEILYTLALTRIPGIGLTTALRLYKAAGSATTLFARHREIRQICPDAQERLQQALNLYPETVEASRRELDFIRKEGIRCLGYNDGTYPARLRECEDAPLLLFYRGNADLNSLHVISMVGTRRCTEYGREICRQFLQELARHCPDVLVISGLAYGIDVNTHQQALANGLHTVGVLAHGLDRIYPAAHTRTAREMLSHGGLLTEYPGGTNPDPFNFVQRNRIVAGLCDACIVVESGEKGGSLITAGIAESYHRDVFAFPGRTTDIQSSGCNRLIRENRAVLLQNAEELMKEMGWASRETPGKQGIQRELFVELSPEENLLVSALRGNDGKAVNTLTVECRMPVSKVSALLFGLEMKGVVKALTGGMYRLL